MHVRVVLLALDGLPVAVSTLVAALGRLVLAADLPAPMAEPALERHRTDALLAAAAALRAAAPE